MGNSMNSQQKHSLQLLNEQGFVMETSSDSDSYRSQRESLNQIEWQNNDEYIVMGVHVYKHNRYVRMNDKNQSCMVMANYMIDYYDKDMIEWEIICHKIGNCSRIGFVYVDEGNTNTIHTVLGNNIYNHFGIVFKENENRIINIVSNEAKMLKSKYFQKAKIQNGDKFCFQMNFLEKTVSLKWNNINLGVIYSNILYPIIPVVSKSGGTAEYEIKIKNV